MDPHLRVAGFQMAVTTDVADNANKIMAAIDRAADQGAEILLTPEGSLSGYTHVFDASAVSAALEDIVQHAGDRGIGLALGTCYVEDDGRCTNQIRFYRPDGEYLGYHAKTLRCGTLAPEPKGEIEHYATAPLRTFPWRPGLLIGGLICNDLWANPQCTPMPDPHLTQQLADLGARIVFHAVNGGRDGSEWSRMVWHYHETNLRMRARAGGLWIVTADSAYPEDGPCSAPSGVIDPSGQFACRTEAVGAQLYIHTIPLADD